MGDGRSGIGGDIHWVQLPAANGREQRGRRPEEALKAALYQQIGPLKVELDWLQKKVWQLG